MPRKQPFVPAYTNLPPADHKKLTTILRRERITMSQYLAALVAADLKKREANAKRAKTNAAKTAAESR